MVRLICFTLQGHLLVYPDLLGMANSTMPETCLTYLKSNQVKAISAGPSSDLWHTLFPDVPSLNRQDIVLDLEDSDSDRQGSPQYSGIWFLEYASVYWERNA